MSNCVSCIRWNASPLRRAPCSLIAPALAIYSTPPGKRFSNRNFGPPVANSRRSAEGEALRGSVESGPRSWVLRHCRRGGYMARFSQDRYLWAGERRVRAFAEYRLLERLMERGLPVPRPIAARYQRAGVAYRCDLIMQRIIDARPLSSMLATADLSEVSWRAIGAAIARLHHAGVDHADLNAHNILLDGRGAVSIIDFDRGRVRERERERGAWTSRNLSRLRRSLTKVSRCLPPARFPAQSWNYLLDGYASEGS